MADISNIFLYPGELREIDREGQYKVMLVDGQPGELRVLKRYLAPSGGNSFGKIHLQEVEDELRELILEMGGQGGIHKNILFSSTPSTNVYTGKMSCMCSAVPVKMISRRYG